MDAKLLPFDEYYNSVLGVGGDVASSCGGGGGAVAGSEVEKLSELLGKTKANSVSIALTLLLKTTTTNNFEQLFFLFSP